MSGDILAEIDYALRQYSMNGTPEHGEAYKTSEFDREVDRLRNAELEKSYDYLNQVIEGNYDALRIWEVGPNDLPRNFSSGDKRAGDTQNESSHSRRISMDGIKDDVFQRLSSLYGFIVPPPERTDLYVEFQSDQPTHPIGYQNFDGGAVFFYFKNTRISHHPPYADNEELGLRLALSTGYASKHSEGYFSYWKTLFAVREDALDAIRLKSGQQKIARSILKFIKYSAKPYKDWLER